MNDVTSDLATLPDLTLTAIDGAPLRLRDLPLPLVLYFYPKDDTQGCTREAQDFSALRPEFDAAGVHVLGVSRDSVKRHANFAAKYDLTVALASDLDETVTQAFGVWVTKRLYGREYWGIERATWLFDRSGRAARVWRRVKVLGHAREVLDAARALG